MEKQLMYVCYYHENVSYFYKHGEGEEINVFVTSNKKLAEDWCEKFNKKLEYWKDKCIKYDDNWHIIWKSSRAEDINNIEYASYYQIELR